MDEPNFRDFLNDHENENHLAYFSAIGRIIVAWGMLEAQFNMNVLMLFEGLGGKSLAKQRPRALGRKIDFWNTCFQNLPTIAGHKKAALEYGVALKETADDRNLMMHTNWGNVMVAKDVGEVFGMGMNSDAVSFTHYNASMSLDWLHKLTNDIANRQTELIPLTLYLAKLSRQK